MKLSINISGIAIYILALLIGAGFAADLDKSQWAYWIGAIGTTGTLIGTIWLATDETRKRNAHEMAVARINAAAMHPRVINMMHICQNVCMTLREIRDDKSHKFIDRAKLKDVGRALGTMEVWNSKEITPLVVLPEYCAENLAGAYSMIAATVSLLQNTELNLENRVAGANFINSNIDMLEECIKFMTSAATVLQIAISRLDT